MLLHTSRSNILTTRDDDGLRSMLVRRIWVASFHTGVVDACDMLLLLPIMRMMMLVAKMNSKMTSWLIACIHRL
jgi:hypothetical protein